VRGHAGAHLIARLAARSFRNLEDLTLDLAAGRHLIFGPNGAGKTSLLEAIYTLATTRSFRTARLQDCARHGTHTFALAGATTAGQHLELEVQSDKRTRRLDFGASKLADHLAALPVVAWTSADLEILLGAPAARRRLLDRGLVGLRPARLDLIRQAREALEAKRRLLQDRVEADVLAPWQTLLARISAELQAARADFTIRLAQAFEALLQEAEFDLPGCSLAYRPSPSEALEGEAAILRAFERVIEREKLLGQPLIGAQRDELEIRFGDQALKRVASAGERKVIGVLLALAHGRVLEEAGVQPLYLLDDLDAELDRERLAKLWSALDSGRQILATSNRPEVFPADQIEYRWRCAEGRLTEV
jgi:DNA replication and repair protein RecF